MTNKELFETRSLQFLSASEVFARQSNKYASVRTIVFLAGLVVSIYFANEREAGSMYLSIIISFTLLVFLVSRHNKIKYNRNHNRFLATINSEENNRIAGNIHSFDQGLEFVDDDHPYTSDLDVFGRSSLFQLINRTGTQAGRQLLAKWLQDKADPGQIDDRQKAMESLADQIEWRQQFQASALHFKDESANTDDLEEWMKGDNSFLGKRFLLGLSFVLPICSIISLWMFFDVGLSFYWFLAVSVIGGLMISQKLKLINHTAEQMTSSLNTIRAIRALLEKIKIAPVESTYLEDIKNQLFNEEYNILKETKNLQLLLQFFDARSNGIYYLINIVLMVDFHLMRAAEKWRYKNKSNLTNWVKTVAEFECINSLAGSLHSHEDFVVPKITNDNQMQFISVGHPLINSAERICNDFNVEGKGKVTIITGSNMSGKSTFLRTLGVNAVMALMGGPVCAKSALVPFVSIFSGMRIKDNLEEHISSFYAELKRISQLLALLKSNEVPIFYLLDEILKGTNSKDRHLGSEALITQLAQTNSFGIISTHDLSLGNLSTNSHQIINQNFSSSIEGNEILFDYKLKQGVCNSFNASKLMEKMGIFKS